MDMNEQKIWLLDEIQIAKLQNNNEVLESLQKELKDLSWTG